MTHIMFDHRLLEERRVTLYINGEWKKVLVRVAYYGALVYRESLEDRHWHLTHRGNVAQEDMESVDQLWQNYLTVAREYPK